MDGTPVRFLWACPITAEECALEQRHGFEALIDALVEAEFYHVIDVGRDSVA